MDLGITNYKLEHFYQNIDGFSSETEQLNLLKTILPILGDNINIAEIGVYKGRCTAMWNVHLLNNDINYNYWAIDHFLGSEEHDKSVDYYSITKENLKPIIEHINLTQIDSFNASKTFNNNFFDMIYIDAAHDYISVKEDINLWLPKLKPGGVICGDDYILGWPGVIQAVDEIFGKENINVVGGQQWWIKIK